MNLLALQPSSKISLQSETLEDKRVLVSCLKVFGVHIYKGKILLREM